ncbi:MAG: type II secretion system protein [Armatimonadetes bacterium]|nr:type II secretion system protein [Armatimonadota bacterium]
MRRTRGGGFTLIELLVVISIISILASMMFPAFAKARNKAEAIVCTSNMSQLGKAFMMYAMDYDHIMPDQPRTTFENSFQKLGYCVDDWTTHSCWANGLYPYVKSYEVYICKDTIGEAPGNNSSVPPLSYIMNGCVAGKMMDAAPNPSGICLLYDWCFDATWCAINPSPDPQAPGSYVRAFYNGQANHDERLNLLYLDGHAKNIAESVFGNDIWYGPANNIFYY